MSKLFRNCGYLLAAVTFCLVGSAFASPLPLSIVTMTFTGTGGSAPLGYAYVYPYYFNLSPAIPSGHPNIDVALTCDDFTDEISYGESWTAEVTSLPNASSGNTYFFGRTNYDGASGLTSYEEAAWLAEEMMSRSPIASVADLQWALWGLFDGTNGVFNADYQADFNTFSTANKNEIKTLLADAAADHGSAASYANVYIYTPVICNASRSNCTVDTLSSRPQEFIRVVPEASTSALLGVGLAGLIVLML